MNRRELLGAGDASHLMPWTDPARIFARCSGCGACARACPEGIVVQGRGGHPFVSFTSACTFCGACADVCDEDVFELERAPPWSAHAVVLAGCLEARGVSCRACEDACPESALRLRPELGGTGSITVDVAACTGCGACVSVCPTKSMTVAADG